MLVAEMVVKASSNQISSNISEESVILNLKNDNYYSLNQVGTRIWHLIQEPTSVEGITAVLQEEYDVEREECQRCVLSLLEELNQHGLIEVQYESRV